jgi:pimeloyl-ACP methyl ester carboxylesterase
MASVPSQNALEVDIALIAGLVGFARDKVYTYGFSMGGLNATSFALRHQDPYGVRTAGIIYHTGTTDIVRDYNEAPPLFQDMIWENPLVFGASPSADPFAYNRVNPTRFDATGVAFDEPYFQLDALKHTPFYFHWNTNDPTKYKTWTSLLEGALVVKGFTLTSATSTTPTPQHTIHSIDINAALDWVTQAPLGPLPSSAEIYADRPARYLWSRLESDPAPNVAHYEVSIETASNSFAVTDTLHVDELCLSLSLMGLDAGQPLSFMAESSDGTTDTYLIAGYPAPPSMILVDGGVVLTWGYDPLTAEVSVTPSTTATGALVEIFP